MIAKGAKTMTNKNNKECIGLFISKSAPYSRSSSESSQSWRRRWHSINIYQDLEACLESRMFLVGVEPCSLKIHTDPSRLISSRDRARLFKYLFGAFF